MDYEEALRAVSQLDDLSATFAGMLPALRAVSQLDDLSATFAGMLPGAVQFTEREVRELERGLREQFFAGTESGQVRVLPSGGPDADMSVEPEDYESAVRQLYKARAALEKSRKVSAAQAAQLDQLRREMPRLQNCRERLKEVLSLFFICEEGYARSAYVAVEDLEVWRRDAQA